MAKSVQRDPFDQLTGQLNDMISRLWQWHAGDFCPVDSWSPQINVYRLERRIEVCVDLAGVQREEIEVHVEPGRLVMRGVRRAPEPRRSPDEPMRILSMEVHHGAFCRTIGLPDKVDLSRVESEYVNGWLWVRLPLRDAG